MARTWLAIQVDLIEGHGEHLWPRPGRIFAAARTHSFAQLANAIDDAFARWDRSHLHEFQLQDGTRLTTPYDDWDDDWGEGVPLDDRRTRLSRLKPGEQFVYVFDFGDDWAHLCTVDRNASTRLRRSVSNPLARCRSGAGETSPISTSVGGTETTANPVSRRTLGCPISRRCGTGGGRVRDDGRRGDFHPLQQSPDVRDAHPTRTRQSCAPRSELQVRALRGLRRGLD